MSDLKILSLILIFWFLIGFVFSLIASDSALQQISIEGNTSFTTGTPTFTNYSSSDEGQTTTYTSWIVEFGKMFGFKIGNVSGFPSWLSIIIGFVNYFLLILVILIAYRLIRSGAG